MSNNIIKMHLDNPEDLVFSISVDGTSESIKEARLTIDKSPLKISAIGESKDEKFVFRFPPLDKVLTPGQAKWELEVFLNNRVFVPLSGSVELIAPVKVEANFHSNKPKEVVVAEMTTPPSRVNVIVEKDDSDLIDVLIDGFFEFVEEKGKEPTLSLIREYESLVLDDDNLKKLWSDKVRSKLVEVLKESSHARRTRPLR